MRESAGRKCKAKTNSAAYGRHLEIRVQENRVDALPIPGYTCRYLTNENQKGVAIAAHSCWKQNLL